MKSENTPFAIGLGKVLEKVEKPALIRGLHPNSNPGPSLYSIGIN
jgi:hypothetical protein